MRQNGEFARSDRALVMVTSTERGTDEVSSSVRDWLLVGR